MKIRSPLLLFIVFAQWVLLPLCWQIELKTIKQAGRYFFEKNEIQHLAFSKHDWNSVKIDEKEFRWQGLMYDIKQIKSQGDSVYIVAKADHKESDWLKKNEHLLNNNTASGNEYQTSIALMRAFPFMLPVLPHIYGAFEQEAARPPLVISQMMLKSSFLDTTAPPPWHLT